MDEATRTSRKTSIVFHRHVGRHRRIEPKRVVLPFAAVRIAVGVAALTCLLAA
jgi:hypothetical protein